MRLSTYLGIFSNISYSCLCFCDTTSSITPQKNVSIAVTKIKPLSYGVEPQPAVLADVFSRFKFYDQSGLLSQISSYILVVVYLSEEADALAVLALCVDKMFALCNLPYFLLHVVSYGEYGLAQLPVVYLG